MIWDLETQDDFFYEQMLLDIVQCAIDGDTVSRNILKGLWPECSWDTIKERLQCEGSTWYVFWMDGVRQFMVNQKEEENEDS